MNDNLDSSLIYHNKSLALRRSLNFKDGIAISTINIAQIEFKRNKLSKAKLYALEIHADEPPHLCSVAVRTPPLRRGSYDDLLEVRLVARRVRRAVLGASDTVHGTSFLAKSRNRNVATRRRKTAVRDTFKRTVGHNPWK